jgi:hypothetical protein
MVGIKLALTNKTLDSNGAPVAAGPVHFAAKFLAKGIQSTPLPSQPMYHLTIGLLGSSRNGARGAGGQSRVTPPQLNGVNFFSSVSDASVYFGNLVTIFDANAVLNQPVNGSFTMLDTQGSPLNPTATIDYSIEFLAQFPDNIRFFGFTFNLSSQAAPNPSRTVSFQLTSSDGGGIVGLFSDLLYAPR